MQLIWEKKLHRICTIAIAVLIVAAIASAIWNLSLYLFNADVLDNLGNQMAASGDSKLVLWLFRDNALTSGFTALGITAFALLTALATIMGLRSCPCSQQTLPERRGALQIIRIFTGFALIAIPVIYCVFYMYGFDIGKFQGNMNFVAMILALPASLYFLFPGITDRFSEFLQTVFGLCFIVFTILSLATTHMYMYEGLTSPVRTQNLLSLSAMMLFVLYEIRFFASKPLPNMYMACAGAAVFFCLTNALPRLILTLLGEMSVSVQTIYAFLELMIAIYAVCRLVLFLSEWKYTIQMQAETEEELPDTVTLTAPDTVDNTIEPDYTEDSEIESPILQAKIDLDLFDRAFEGNTPPEQDALDSISEDTFDYPEEATSTDSLDSLELLLSDPITEDEPLNTEEPSTTDKLFPTEENAENSLETDSFDSLTDAMFGTDTEAE